MNREIIEQYPEDFPFPSCLVFGFSSKNEIIHVVMSDEGSVSSAEKNFLQCLFWKRLMIF